MITYTKIYPDGTQELVKFPIYKAAVFGFSFKDENGNDCLISSHDKQSVVDYRDCVIRQMESQLNGDMANQFNESQDSAWWD